MRLAAMLLFASLAWAFSIGQAAEERLIDVQPSGPFVWPSQPPADCPFEQSKDLAGVLFTGVHSDYHCGDTWYPSWASDDNLYSPWTDGQTDGVPCGSGAGAKARTGHAVLKGDDPLKLEIHNTSPPKQASALPYRGRYPCGSLVHNGIWYYGTYCLGPEGSTPHNGFVWNWPNLGPMPGFQISRDFGKTWEPSPLSPEKPLFPEPRKFLGPVKMGAPHFVDFGRNMEHSPDGKAYLLGMGAEENDPKPRPCIKPGKPGEVYQTVENCKDDFAHANLSWITGDQVYLARVAPSVENINDATKYEFFAGHDAAGKPAWTGDFAKIRPLADWNNNMGCATITYNAPLKKYLMCVTDGWPTVAKMHSYILEADAITGPWRMVVYMKDFGEQAYFLNFPSKFIGKDGRTLWLCYSANFSPGWNGVRLGVNPPGGRYGLCLHEMRLLKPGEKVAAAADPLKSAENLARKAKVEASSVHDGYSAEGAIDGVAGGYPENTGNEWASKGEKAGAWIKLTWPEPQTIGSVVLVDRPNTLDQITAGRLELSDGTAIELKQPLPDDGRKGVEIRFEPKKVTSLRFVVTGVKDGSPNIGLSEIGAFEK